MFVRSVRRCRTIEIRPGDQVITAADPPHDLHEALDRIHRDPAAHQLRQPGKEPSVLACNLSQRNRCRCCTGWRPSVLAHGLATVQEGVSLSSDSDPACPETIKARIANNRRARDARSFWCQRRLF